MIVILESPTGKRKWKIEPEKSGMCYRVLKTPIGVAFIDGVLLNKKGTPIKADWIDCKIYPTTLMSAVSKVVDLMLADPEDQVEVEFKGIDIREGMNKIFKRWLNQVMKTLEVKVDE